MLNDESDSAQGIALDLQNNKVYWVDLVNNGEILRADLDGSNSESLVAGDEDGVTGGITDIDLDLENEKMYWVKRGAIMRADLDGANVETVVEITSFVQPPSIAVNTRDGVVYWVDSSSGAIMHADMENGEAEVLVVAEDPAGLSLDLENGKIYWLNDYFMTGEGGSVDRANLDGTEVERVFDTGFTRGYLHVVGFEIPTSISPNDELPNSIQLGANYPNPFNPQTTITYELAKATPVTLQVFNSLGQKVKTLLNNQVVSEGINKVVFDASDFPSGIYFYTLQTAEATFTRPMTLVK
ncbi:MAG: T9SS type A sorting domain-containing protein [Balneolaceae bacterium]